VIVSRAVSDNLKKASWIRRMFEEGARLKKERGADNVFDFTLGNPEVEPPALTLETLRRTVERGLPGFEVSRKLDKMGMRASDTAELALQDCPVPAENLLGEEGRGFHQLAAGLQRERIMAAVLALSGAAQALEDTLAYLRERHAFGAPLATRQALRHRVADMATEIEAARHLVYHAASLYTAGRDCVTEVSMAKLFATEVANRVAYQAVQLHGGYGYMREYPIERFFRDIRLLTIGGGTSEIMKEIIAKQMEL